MSNEAGFDIRFHHRHWFTRLFGHEPFRIEIELPRGLVAAADAKTVQGAWNGAVLAAKLFAGVEIVSSCPFDKRGKLLPAAVQP